MPASFAPPHDPYPTTLYEAELSWELERQRLGQYIATLPNSSFEKTKFEEDECFYATFPRARQAAVHLWIVERYPFAPWAQSLVAAHQDSIDLTYDMSLARQTPISSHVPAPVVNFTTYTLDQALNVPSSSSPNTSMAKAVPKAPGPTPPQAPPMPFVHYDYSGNAISSDPDTGPKSVLMDDKTLFSNHEASSVVLGTPSYDDNDDGVLRKLQVLVPGRRASKKTQKLPVHSPPASRKQKNIYPSTCPTSSTSTLDTPSSPPSSRSLSFQPTTVSSDVPHVIYTGNWETDAIAAAEYVHFAKSTGRDPTVSIPMPALPLLPIKPHIVAHLSPPPHRSPPECSTSMSPPNKRSKVIHSKPKRACPFCRSRKIACGPPPRGSNNPACNQCARRGLKCKYPSINHDGGGMRKNLVQAHVIASQCRRT
ncbi:hypothetical protein C0995_006849 [Termitomyces sp. Mi166|nr:hypothetical protein C0995_006849 [Termitomyces sp. Mi166\